MNTLTVPKIKDLFNKPTEQYKDIFNTLNKEKKQLDKSNVLEDSSSAMTNELTQFFNDLKKTSTVTPNNTEPLGEPLSTTINNSNIYSPF